MERRGEEVVFCLCYLIGFPFRAAKGDIAVICSDGIHDNLDPEFLAFTPQQCNLDSKTWDSG